MPNPAAFSLNPWRFQSGDTVYVRGWPIGAAATVTKQIQMRSCTLKLSYGYRAGRTFPAYFVVDEDGHEWQVPQVALSKSVIPADS